MRPSDKNFDVDTEDFPHLRARPTWVSADENVDNIQNEINVYADGQKLINSVGRSMKRDIQIKLKAVSADHCAIAYTQDKGWTITERGKDRLSSNGTFIFMKSMQQMNDHVPSDMIPLHDDMIISFVNYELRVSLLQKTKDELVVQNQKMEEFFANKGKVAPPAPVRDTPTEPVEDPAYTAEVAPNATSDPPADSNPPTEQPPATEQAEEEKKEEAPAEATEEELADAATKISAVYKGKKAREEVAKLKSDKEASQPAVESVAPAENPPAEVPPTEAKPEVPAYQLPAENA